MKRTFFQKEKLVLDTNAYQIIWTKYFSQMAKQMVFDN
jgi:hypothetical protein